MYFNLDYEQQQYLLSQPETGMGYQVVEAAKPTRIYEREKYIVLNSQMAVEMDSQQNYYVSKIIREGIFKSSGSTGQITLSGIKVYNEREFRNVFNESRNSKERAAIENPKEFANGQEVFVRLSAYDNDLRIDKINKCLRPGSYTTTEADYSNCKKTNDNPINRYALPNEEKVEWAFHIRPLKTDILQRGAVQPANNKSGGGVEIYFEKGTSNGTYLKQTPY